MPAPSEEGDTPDENGITNSMLDFSWDRDVEMSVSWTRMIIHIEACF